MSDQTIEILETRILVLEDRLVALEELVGQLLSRLKESSDAPRKGG